MHFQQQQQQQQQQQVIHGRTNISPESPTQNSQNHHLNHARSTKHLQQIKGLRNPMYVPAVLRVSQNGLSTPSRSQSNSPEDLSSSHNNYIILNNSNNNSNNNNRIIKSNHKIIMNPIYKHLTKRML